MAAASGAASTRTSASGCRGRAGRSPRRLPPATSMRVSEDDAEAMRRSGLTHLLSVSGLHITAVVGAAMLLTLRLLALSQRLALRVHLVLVAAAVGALAGIGYTWLTGMQVPTVRTCIAALLVLGGIALGREALSLRLVAVGAFLIMLWRPEAVAGRELPVQLRRGDRDRRLPQPAGGAPAAVARATTVAAAAGRGLSPRCCSPGWWSSSRWCRSRCSISTRPGSTASPPTSFAIPLTTFVIMPLEAGALLLDPIGLGAPVWALAGWSLDRLLALAHLVAGLDGRGRHAAGDAAGGLRADGRRRAVAVPVERPGARLRAGPVRARRRLGDRHAAARPAGHRRRPPSRGGRGRRALLLRERSGDFTTSIFGEAAGFDGEAPGLGQRAQGAVQPRQLRRRRSNGTGGAGCSWSRAPRTACGGRN